MADAAQLLRQLQHADLVADDLLVSRHRVVSSSDTPMSTLGDDTPSIPTCQILMAWNADGTRKPYRQYSELLCRL